MAIKLTWAEVNYGEEEHRIYRSTSTIDPQNPPTPIATVAADVTEYEDDTVTIGTTYYYRVAALNQGTLYFSDEVSLEATEEYDPGSLFLSSEEGMFYDFSDLSTMFQDTAGTVPVTADGDPVARVNDKGPNGIDLLQSSSGARPTYRTDGNLHWLESNKTDWLHSSALSTLGSAWAVSYGCRFFTYEDYFGPYRFLRDGGSATGQTDNRLEEYTRTAANDRALISRYQAAGTNSNRTGVFPAEGTDLVAWANRNIGVEEKLGEYFDGSTTTEVTTALPYSSGTARLSLFRGYQGDIANMRIYSFFYIARGLSASERADINNWSALKSGVTI